MLIKTLNKNYLKKIEHSNLDNNWINETNQTFADYGIEAQFKNLKTFKGNFLQVIKMVKDFVEELQQKALKKENL